MAFEALKERLEKNGFAVSVFETAAEAADYLNREIDGTSVACGGSMGLKSMGLHQSLAEHNDFYYHTHGPEVKEQMKKAAKTEYYILTANGVAEDTGEIINIDSTGNRVASSLFGHKKVYIVVGKNKVSPDFASALHRARNVVAPQNARRLGCKTPCAVKADRCYNCDSPDRICNGLVVFYKKMKSMEMEVVLVNEEIGY